MHLLISMCAFLHPSFEYISEHELSTSLRPNWYHPQRLLSSVTINFRPEYLFLSKLWAAFSCWKAWWAESSMFCAEASSEAGNLKARRAWFWGRHRRWIGVPRNSWQQVCDWEPLAPLARRLPLNVAPPSFSKHGAVLLQLHFTPLIFSLFWITLTVVYPNFTPTSLFHANYLLQASALTPWKLKLFMPLSWSLHMCADFDPELEIITKVAWTQCIICRHSKIKTPTCHASLK